MDVISPEESHRITTMVMAAMNSRKGEADFPRVDSIYYEEQAKLRITITVVLFHGSGTNSSVWIRDVAGWAQRYRVYAVDMMGSAQILETRRRARQPSG